MALVTNAVSIFTQILALINKVLVYIKRAKRQKEQTELDANPGQHLHDYFADGLCDDKDSDDTA